jgi:hypothetical protein
MTSKRKKMTKEQREKCRVTTPVFRVSYPHVFEAQAPQDSGKKKFSITMLFPKDTDLTKLKKAMFNAKIAAFGPKENWPEDLESPVSWGDDHIDKETKKIKEGYKNHWVIKASSNENQKPPVVDRDKEPIINTADFYAGCFARAHILATNWAFGNKEGIMFILDHVQKVKDGKPFGGKKSADQVFGALDDEDDSDFETEVEDDGDEVESFL